jgi:hypothetical protein
MLHSVADVTPNGTATKLSSTSKRAAWVYLVATGSSIRVGDSTVSATTGSPVPTTGLMLPPCGSANSYDLSSIYVFGAAGADKAACTYHTI